MADKELLPVTLAVELPLYGAPETEEPNPEAGSEEEITELCANTDIAGHKSSKNVRGETIVEGCNLAGVEDVWFYAIQPRQKSEIPCRGRVSPWVMSKGVWQSSSGVPTPRWLCCRLWLQASLGSDPRHEEQAFGEQAPPSPRPPPNRL